MRDVLIALCDLVKIEFQYLSSLQTGMVRIYEVLKEENPGFAERYIQRANTDLFYREYPGAREQLEKLAALLEKLQKPS